MIKFLNGVLIFLFLILGWIASGYVVTRYWEWFYLPAFGGKLLTIPQAMGIGMALRYVFIDPGKKSVKRNADDWWHYIALDFIISGIALIFGKLLTFFL